MILSATYGVQHIPTKRMDVTTQLQFWVTSDSRLMLPEGSKCHMMGFYDVAGVFDETEDEEEEGYEWNGWRNWWTGEAVGAETRKKDLPTLKVRYKMGNGTYEVKIKDDEGLVLPSPQALLIGDSDIVV